MAQTLHLGRKISKMRELRGIKQEAVAFELGITQQAISKMEQSERIDEGTLEKIANFLGVTTDDIKNYNDEPAIYNVQNNYEGSNNTGQNQGAHSTFNFNPIDKWLEVIEENKKLYERLIQSEKDKVDILKKAEK